MKTTDKKVISDKTLVNGLAKGNRVAFNQIYDRYWKRLYNYVYNILRCEGLAEDVVQDVFLKVWENRSTTRIKTLETYLFYASRNKAISVIRRVKFTDFQEELISNLSHVPKVEQELGLKDLKQSIEHATDYLPPRCKEIFHMSRFDQLSIVEISETLGISPRSVENQLSLALRHIRKHLGNSFISILFILTIFLFKG